MIQQLTEFTVTLDYGRSHTTFLVHVDGQQEPVVRVHKDAAYDHSPPYQVFAGPGLGQLVGYVNDFSAIAPDRRVIGRVEHKNRSWRPDEWTVTQEGFGTLNGEPVGATNKARRALPVLDWGVVDAALSFKMHWHSAQSQGFELARHAGVRATYTVKIHDPRLDRLLVLAALVHFNRFGTSDLRQSVVDVTANPFKA
ncbi:hypothetical protein AB0L06_06520 [Spirillospora sp. NPDC052269]